VNDIILFAIQQSSIQEVTIVPTNMIYYDKYIRQIQIRDITKINMQIKVSLKLTMHNIQSRKKHWNRIT